MTPVIEVDYRATEYKRHDGDYWSCEHPADSIELEVWTEYWPSQEQIDQGTDHDVRRTGFVCQNCGEIIK